MLPGTDVQQKLLACSPAGSAVWVLSPKVTAHFIAPLQAVHVGADGVHPARDVDARDASLRPWRNLCR
jgi:hypothetical protein